MTNQTDNRSPAYQRLDDVRLALSYLTRVPIGSAALPARALGEVAWAFPLTGLAVGLPAAGAAGLALWLGLPAPLAASLAVAVLVLASGALHEDGLADCADGLAGRDPAQRRAIMRDSRIGTYGVLALILVTLGRIAALAGLAEAGWMLGGAIAAAAGSRAVLPLAMCLFSPADGEGEGRRAGAVAPLMAASAAGIGLICVFAATGIAGLIAAIPAALAVLAVGHLARLRLGGYTGDVLGAAQQLAELALLATLVAIAA